MLTDWIEDELTPLELLIEQMLVDEDCEPYGPEAKRQMRRFLVGKNPARYHEQKILRKAIAPLLARHAEEYQNRYGGNWNA